MKFFDNISEQTQSPPFSSPPENSLHSSDAHPIHNVPGQSEGDGLRGGEDLPLLKGYT